MMTPEQKDGMLQRNRTYKMGIRHAITMSDQSGVIDVAGGSAYSSPSTPAIRVEPCRLCNHKGILCRVNPHLFCVIDFLNKYIVRLCFLLCNIIS